MSEFVTTYGNPVQSTGLRVIEPTPLDDRTFVATESELYNIFTGIPTAEKINFIASLYNGAVVTMLDTKRRYVWTESGYGLLSTPYRYPSHATDVAGQNYANKNYNFVIYDSFVHYSVTYNDIADTGLFVPRDFMPLHLINNMQVANITMKSSSTSFTEQEYPDSAQIQSDGLTVILDPKPSIGEEFIITIY